MHVSVGDLVQDGDSEVGALRVNAANDLRGVVDAVRLVPRIDALGREREEEVLTGSESGALEDRFHDLISRPRVCRAFEDHELSAAKSRRDPLGRFDDVAQVRLLCAIKGRLDRNKDEVGLAQRVVIGCRLEASVHDRGSELFVADVADIAGALSQLRDPLLVEIEGDDRETGTREGDREWESDIPTSDNGHARRPVGDLPAQLGGAHDASDTR